MKASLNIGVAVSKGMLLLAMSLLLLGGSNGVSAFSNPHGKPQLFISTHRSSSRNNLSEGNHPIQSFATLTSTRTRHQMTRKDIHDARARFSSSVVERADDRLSPMKDSLNPHSSVIKSISEDRTPFDEMNLEQEVTKVNSRTENRRQILASIMLASSTIMGIQDTQATELTWAESPVNKRSGITLFRAEENGYNVRFITYLSRFLLSFDNECQKWWIRRAKDIPYSSTVEQVDMTRFRQFGAFSASVEIGLQEYNGKDGPARLMKNLLKRCCPEIEELKAMREESGLPPFNPQQEAKEKREIKEARRQIALLFSLLDTYQPVEEITQTLAAIDNATITEISIVHRGGGYSPGTSICDCIVHYITFSKI